jgi:hypothetical protein
MMPVNNWTDFYQSAAALDGKNPGIGRPLFDFLPILMFKNQRDGFLTLSPQNN